MSANVLALSQENRRFLSCHGQIRCKSLPPSKPLLLGRTAELIVKGRRDPDGPSVRNDRCGGFGRRACGWARESERSTYLGGCLRPWVSRSGKAAARGLLRHHGTESRLTAI